MLEPGPHGHLRSIWALQLSLLAVRGIIAFLMPRMPRLAVMGWWLAGVFFALGIYAFERLIARHLVGAALEA